MVPGLRVRDRLDDIERPATGSKREHHDRRRGRCDARLFLTRWNAALCLAALRRQWEPDLPSGIGWLPDSTIAITGSTTSGSIPPLDGQNSGDFDGFVLRVGGLGILSAEQPPTQSAPFRIAGSRLLVSLPEECRSAQLVIYTLSGLLSFADQQISSTADIELPAGVYAVRLHCVQGEEYRAVVVVL